VDLRKTIPALSAVSIPERAIFSCIFTAVVIHLAQFLAKGISRPDQSPRNANIAGGLLSFDQVG
jgi:hypothetical protein